MQRSPSLATTVVHPWVEKWAHGFSAMLGMELGIGLVMKAGWADLTMSGGRTVLWWREFGGWQWTEFEMIGV